MRSRPASAGYVPDSYESDNFMEVSRRALIRLAKHYGWGQPPGLCETKDRPNADLAGLRWSGRMIERLKNGMTDHPSLCGW